MKRRRSIREQGGAILDLGDGRKVGEEPDLSWMPDTDELKEDFFFTVGDEDEVTDAEEVTANKVTFI